MIALRLRLRIPRIRPVVPAPPRRPTRRRARAAVGAFVALTLVANVGYGLVLDYGTRLRDPEYGKRFDRVRKRVRENPARPLVLVIGSSRTAMGVRPDAVEPNPGPMIFNLSLAGSGSVMELMTLRRAIADGAKPAAVVLEYWPAFLRADGGYHEQHRVDVSRLRPVDLPTVREFYDDPAKTEQRMWELRVCPWFSHRKSLMNQACGSWLPYTSRSDLLFGKIDPWGWLPGREGATDEQRADAMKAVGDYYRPLFARYEVSPVADRALRQAVAECRAAGVPVALVYLPESAAFRAFMPPAAVKLADEHLAKTVAELNVPLIDGRGWVPDADLPDGFHLTQSGAAEFTRKLLPAVAATFPNLGGAK
ncbi:MAG: hypothetical protein ACRC7O_04780 [Fimbriiglobus sp.]